MHGHGRWAEVFERLLLIGSMEERHQPWELHRSVRGGGGYARYVEGHVGMMTVASVLYLDDL